MVRCVRKENLQLPYNCSKATLLSRNLCQLLHQTPLFPDVAPTTMHDKTHAWMFATPTAVATCQRAPVTTPQDLPCRCRFKKTKKEEADLSVCQAYTSNALYNTRNKVPDDLYVAGALCPWVDSKLAGALTGQCALQWRSSLNIGRLDDDLCWLPHTNPGIFPRYFSDTTACDAERIADALYQHTCRL
jgi:hypothetical protein